MRRPLKNLRVHRRDPTTHEDFEWKRGLPKYLRVDTNPAWVRLKKKIDQGYFDFSICWWGNLGQIRKIDSNSPGNVFYIKECKRGVKEVFEKINWKQAAMISVGAPQITSEMLIAIYEEHTNTN